MKRMVIFLAISTLIATGAVLLAFSMSKVEMTGGGVHTRLLVPVGFGAIGLQAYAGTGEDVVLTGHLDGPVVRRLEDSSWIATWFCEDRIGHARGTAPTLRIDCAGREFVYPLDSAPVPPAVASMPDRLAVLSDLEGNLRFLDATLVKLGVTGENGRWTFGEGQVVVLGDSVDRGRDSFAVLWRLHALAQEAHAAGGAVRMVLGNHDQYILRGNTSRAHPEHRYALREMGGVAQSFAADTVIGEWLRAQPVALKLGRVLFVHGGASPEIADAGLSVQDLNEAMRGYWHTAPSAKSRSKALDAVLGHAGVTQYRGYFRGVDGVYGPAAQIDVERVLKHFGVDRIVIGHTLVERIETRYEGRVYAVNVNDNEARPEVLFYRNAKPTVVDTGVSRALEKEPRTSTREFSLLDARDRQLVGGMFRAYRQLAAVPQPY